ncbi:hypothetical protein A2313_04795 [Candidatus Roizmanbacteria bacterium RIFOXYB2_FULL_41_10]|uniref:Uncharacterized protein n=1 Tax=Candidatus Roizmanbacteria bacterium RIFOXYA1_FULL_41_12 TaxID=1802082 RepID=A0A1F7K9I8_9BACT|nr:MAG: hypothetical protein A2209_02335 [Candidatus Roizmanbacteria bacterium RIFOXYA1_FULL_41_12]OGK67307.1 MAG: hypothetical protein A2377_00135 [Candidatus Roizmanbacteria bacterium RIFOXYB1_FULL_41_27]OGK69165.1 MAG: hypothetical protein A2313_04795 [Candidatus Roizmanbacteria bacterium RIFOXYB2_FULL_41_10]OGK71840.1 MAG: hypothetical protein A2403_02815 [Candidatus Roizmanbacteria bacterium RIFOXYC1_FULL_41_16]HLD92250.1 hypothetical protein [Patescibacteria group bacterium]
MAIKKFKLTEIVKYYDKVENRLGEMAKEIRNDSFNFVSIFVSGFLLALFTNIYANFLYDLFKKYNFFYDLVSVIIIVLLLFIYRKFTDAFIKPKNEEIRKIEETLSGYKKLLKKK